MAELVAGIGISHVPSLARVLETDRTDSSPDTDFLAFHEAGEWIREKNPDVVVVIYNDHGSALSLEFVPTFAIGAAKKYLPADEGRGRRPVPDFPGDQDLSWHLIDSVVPEGFDLTVCQRLDVDHGLSEPLVSLFGTPEEWPMRVVPIAVNVVQQPTPSAQRCFDLGKAIGRAIASYPEDVKVAVIGTGGMSHQLQGQRAGHINSEFDRMFLSKIVEDPDALTALSNMEYIDLAGSEGAELVMWLVMRGAMDATASAVHSGYRVPISSTAAGVVTLENPQ
ncbi:protocatechuate 3,4-dioxygenase [Arthrobacter sp. CDRTa11]|uniref:class III extradiol dioxygenase subunit beta n=1 Tax=Arthrobacter sp. CDRTa11 TaxID=2651199 RepID=UPI002265E522|nr:class III extradiol dioxygenase subunit beta [Arthrobacter sp. CDRTa11]UZX02870.1 protocatechuate 3,4-dioxygenase [Arthrobacter sp. CDRTa11]